MRYVIIDFQKEKLTHQDARKAPPIPWRATKGKYPQYPLNRVPGKRRAARR